MKKISNIKSKNLLQQYNKKNIQRNKNDQKKQN